MPTCFACVVRCGCVAAAASFAFIQRGNGGPATPARVPAAMAGSGRGEDELSLLTMLAQSAEEEGQDAASAASDGLLQMLVALQAALKALCCERVVCSTSSDHRPTR